MRNGVNKLSEVIFEIDDKKNIFINLRKKNSEISKYWNYILLKKKDKELKKNSSENNLILYHKKLPFFPSNSESITKDMFNNKKILKKRSFFNTHSKFNKKISFSNINNNINKNIKLKKIRNFSANYKTINQSSIINLKSIKNNIFNNNNINNYNNNNKLILIPLGLKNKYNKKKESENKEINRNKYNKKITFKNNNPFYKINLINSQLKYNDMIFPKRFLKLKRDLLEGTYKTKRMIDYFEDYFVNEK